MIRRNQQNRKAYVDINCPTCGMKLDDPKVEGFVLDRQTYCCEGCAKGTGCTCDTARISKERIGQKRGHMGHRNPENSLRDHNFNGEVTTSGQKINGSHAAKKTKRFRSRVPYVTESPKSRKSLTKPKDSTREQARGRVSVSV